GRCRQPVHEKLRGDERLERGTRLERLAHDGIAEEVHPLTLAGHRADLAILRIEDDDVTTIGTGPRHRIIEGLLRDLLQLLIDRQHDGITTDGGNIAVAGRLEAMAP